MTTHVSRREFLKSASVLSASSLVLGFAPTSASLVNAATATSTDFNPFVRVAPGGQVTAIIKHFECGQGAATGLATLIAEELGVHLDEVNIEFAPHNPKLYANLAFGFQGTGGSSSMANSYLQYRQAGAAAKEVLLSAAASQWGVNSKDLAITDGMITGAGQSAPLADFVAAAATQSVPETPQLKSPDQFTLIGNPATARRDNLPKVTGTAPYAMDLHLEGQVVAVILRSPKFGGKVVSVDTSAAAAVPGFVNAIALPTATGVAVYGQDTWSAFQARKAVKVEWDFSAAETRSSDEIKAELINAVNTDPQWTAKGDGVAQVQAQLDSAAKVIEQDFYQPYLAHATMEPLTCTIEPTADGVILHDGSQTPSGGHSGLTAVLQLPPEKIQVNTLYAGGTFGRRSTPTADYQVEAALAFALMGGTRPVKLVWSREDDLSGGFYRPAAAHKVKVGLNAAGDIVAWDHRVALQSIFKGTPWEQVVIQNGVDSSSVEGVSDTHYDIPGHFVGLTDIHSPIPVSWWRAVGHSHTAFVMESMMDMAAAAARRDPVEFRLALLAGGSDDQTRLAQVLILAAQKSGWDTPVAAGRARGVAVHKSFGSYVAQVVEISRNATDAVHIEKVTCAVDCGVPVNPDIIKAQMEGGIGYGLGHVMRDQITFNDGVVNEANFPQYQPLRINDISEIETHIIPSATAPTGVGEPGLPPAGPALANAIAVNGPRVTHLPMTAHGVVFA